MLLIKGFIQKYLNIIAGIAIIAVLSYIVYLNTQLYLKSNKITNLNNEIKGLNADIEKANLTIEKGIIQINGQNRAIENLAKLSGELNEKLQQTEKVNKELDNKLKLRLAEKAPKECNAALNWLVEKAGELKW